MTQRLHRRQRVYPRADVVEHDSGAFRHIFQPAKRRRLYDVEGTKKYKARQ